NSREPYPDRCEKHEAQEVDRGLVVACGDPSVSFDLAEEVLDQVPFLVDVAVDLPGSLAAGGRGNHDPDVLLVEGLYDVVGIVGFVGDEVVTLGPFDERGGFGDVVDVAACEVDVQGITEPVHKSVDFGGKASARASNTLNLSPPFPPAASWWDLT